MSKHSNTKDVTDEDLVAILCRKATAEQRERVKAALADPESYASQWLQCVRMAAADPFGIDLGKLIELTENDLEADAGEPWLLASCEWEPVARNAAAYALLLLAMIRRRVPLMPLPTRSKGTSGSEQVAEPKQERLREHVERGDPVVAADAGHWIHLTAAPDSVRMRAGLDSADLFEHFTIEFREGDTTLLQVESTDGVVSLGMDEFAAVTGVADKLVIVPLVDS